MGDQGRYLIETSEAFSTRSCAKATGFRLGSKEAFSQEPSNTL